MKKLFCILLLLLSLPAIACQSKVRQFKNVRYDEIRCKAFGVVEFVEPKILYQGDWVRFAIKTTDGNGICPKNEPSCYQPYYSWKEKMHKYCRKVGFKRSLTTRTYVFHSGVRAVGLIYLDQKRNYRVRPVVYNNKLSTLKKIICQ